MLCKQLYFKEILGRLDLGQHYSLAMRWLKAGSNPVKTEYLFESLMKELLTINTTFIANALDDHEPRLTCSEGKGCSFDLATVQTIMRHSGVLSSVKAGLGTPNVFFRKETPYVRRAKHAGSPRL